MLLLFLGSASYHGHAPLPLISSSSSSLPPLVLAASLLDQPLETAAALPPPPLPPLHSRRRGRAAVRLSEDEINPGAVAGTDLRILEYPHPLLRAENAEVTEFDDELKKLTKEMFAIMYASRGVGLAAPQLGINKQLMVFNPDGDPKKWLSEVVLCNPRIEDYSASTALEEEGCLSFPGFTADVVRSSNIKVVWQGLNGKTKRKKLRGWEARIFQHEFDHLDGTLYVDRLKDGERTRVQANLDELIAAYEKDPVDGPPKP